MISQFSMPHRQPMRFPQMGWLAFLNTPARGMEPHPATSRFHFPARAACAEADRTVPGRESPVVRRPAGCFY